MPLVCSFQKREYITDNSKLVYMNNSDIESITDCSEDEDDDIMTERMDKLLNDLPDLGRLFNLHGQVGEGTFSTVYVASLKTDTNSKRCYAIKHIVPTCHPDRIKFELKCLKDMGGFHNVAGIDLCLRNGRNVIFVMPYQRHDSFCDYAGNMDAVETALYMKNLLTAIAHVHTFSIIHRDIKPSNFLYDRCNKKFLLVDFGLAQTQVTRKYQHLRNGDPKFKRKGDGNMRVLHHQLNRPILQNRQLNVLHMPKSSISTRKLIAQSQKENNSSKPIHEPSTHLLDDPIFQKSNYSTDLDCFVEGCNCYGKAKACSICLIKKNIQASRAGTPGFRPPEVLFKCIYQTTAIDIWSAGIILLSIISNSSNFFSCPNDISALAELMTLFGYASLKKTAHDFGRHLVCSENKSEPDLRKICCVLRNRGNKCGDNQGKKCIDKETEEKFPDSAYNLLKLMLKLNPTERITAEDALKHPFFSILIN